MSLLLISKIDNRVMLTFVVVVAQSHKFIRNQPSRLALSQIWLLKVGLWKIMVKAQIYRALVVFFLSALLFGSSIIISIMTAEVMFAIAAVMSVPVLILMFFWPQLKTKN